MIIIGSNKIESLSIPADKCVEWVREAFIIKNQCQLPPKISLHPQGNDFFNTMPCMSRPEKS